MVGQNPNLSLTLPKNFVFHYTDGNAPKTPEQERPEFPEAPALNRNLHSARPTIVARDVFNQDNPTTPASDVAVPTIENDNVGVVELTNLFRRPEVPSSNPQALSSVRRFLEGPKTPSAEPKLFRSVVYPNDGSAGQRIVPEGCSESDDATDTSDEEDFDSSTNCTSPGYGSMDPFKDCRPSINPRRRVVRHGFSTISENPQAKRKSKMVTVPWTSEMEKHLMGCFNLYCNDVTKTPFKHNPGSAPPLGVCHQVAAMAKRLWRGGKSGSAGHHVTTESVEPKTCEENTASMVKANFVVWPKSGASTRRRLRAICKRQQVMTPYYVRLMHSRSPEPIDRSFGFGKPIRIPNSPYDSHAMSLSLADSMQPNAPIARLTRDDGIEQPTPRTVGTAVPWASPAPIPSDIEASPSSGDSEMRDKPPVLASHFESPNLPRLASPFTNQTWGPAATYSFQKSSTPPTFGQDTRTTIPKFVPEFPGCYADFDYPGMRTLGPRRRRDLSKLERAMGSEGNDGEDDGLPDPDLPRWKQSAAASWAQPRHYQPSRDRASIRDERAPSFSLTGARSNRPQSDLSSLAETIETGLKTAEANEAGASLARLASPFAGINPRPSRSRRTLSSGSHGILGGFPSIEERMSDTNRHNPF